MRPRTLVLAGAVACVALAAGCSDSPSPAPDQPREPRSAAPTQAAPPTQPPTQATEPAPAPQSAPRVAPDDVRVATAQAAVRHLAGRIGPRPGTSPAYFRAAAWVHDELAGLGWQVRRQRFRAPAGVSWGVPVPGGRSTNVIATRGDVRPGRPWLLVGAHLDTVPQAPGAEDNASGVGVLLAVAEAVAARRTRLPVVLVAFGAEEPRGPTDADHHYGSRAYVASLPARERRALRGMVSLDRVGVGGTLPVGSVEAGDPLRAEVLAAARRAGVPTQAEDGQRSSDHWSFVRAGLPGVRLGSTPYAGYHSAGDTPGVVEREQLERTARTVVAWLR
ncbi:M28 family metallopeptidase [Nocardioides pantholopis]|uniref:M28 family metallopeptidase n=1 Tax=Nocardioides pantholopis TaxID=2483798 RepID=UPI000F07FDB7|nr:M28 family peptidase [Nocardioides pantholopis]